MFFSGSILGRRVLRVRICSCPKRDKEKDENKFCKQENQPPLGKRRKLDGKKIATPNNSSASSSDVRLYSFTVSYILVCCLFLLYHFYF